MPLPEYSRWEDVPENLKTRTQLGRMGLRPARDQKPTAVKTHWHRKTPDYDLYDVFQAIPKKVPTEAQKQALEKAVAASLAARTCQGCGWIEELGRHYRRKPYIRDGYCPRCRELISHRRDREAAASWAADILAMPLSQVLILDTETTGLDGEIIELAVINLAGETLFNSRFKPISEVEAGATAVHGLTAEHLKDEPAWVEHHAALCVLLGSAELVLIYNSSFDTARIRTTCRLHSVETIEFKSDCLMVWYAQWVNDWSNYWGDYRWQPLFGGDHTALGDCLAALRLLKRMAENPTPEDDW